MEVSLVFLTLNEIAGFRQIIDNICFDTVDESFCVDGGSTDGTREFFLEKSIPLYAQRAKGRGEAFRIAFEKSKCDACIFFSPDGNEDPKDIPTFRSYLEEGYDIVIATRMAMGGCNEEDSQIFKWRKWANNAFNIMANLTWNKGPFITDTINGYRGIKRDAWERIVPDGHGYTIEYQSSIRAFKKGLRIIEFPTIERSRIDRREGSPSIKTGLAFLRTYFSELKKGNY